MDRRHAMGLMGVAAAGLTALQAKLAFAADTEHAEHFEKCAKICSSCAQVCHSCARHCQKMEATKKEYAVLRQDCAGCGELCRAAEMLSSWENTEMAPIACEACAKACDQCAAACEKHPEDKRLAECAKSCRECAKSCRDMVKLMSK
jgi:hypothetical protein